MAKCLDGGIARHMPSRTQGRRLAARFGEVLGPVHQFAAVRINRKRDTYFRKAGIHDVLAVRRTGEPAGRYFLGRHCSRSDVFADNFVCAKAGPDNPYARRTPVLPAVIEVIGLGHVL